MTNTFSRTRKKDRGHKKTSIVSKIIQHQPSLLAMVSPAAPTLQQRLQQRKEFDSALLTEEPMTATISKSTVPVTLGKSEKCVRKELLYKLGFESNNNGPAPALPSNSRGSLLGQVTTRTEPLKYDPNFDKMMLERKERALLRSSSGVGTSVFSALGALFAPQTPLPQPHSTTTATAQRDDAKSDDDSASSDGSDTEDRSASPSAQSGSSKGGVSFNDQVTVIPIPKRDEYSKRIRNRLWVNAQELQSQVARNAVEFAAEGWDWKQTLDDEAMYVCALTGEKVHPVHCEPHDDD
jgi:hypothetical protein